MSRFNQDLFSQYQEMIAHIPKLEEKRQKEYVKSAQSGNINARDQVIYANLHLVLRLAISYQNEIDIMDLIQEGNIGLIKAIQEFDCDRKTSFTNYAIWKIKGQFTEYFRRKNSIVYPANIVDLAKKIEKLEQTMSEQEIKKECNLTDKEWILYQQFKKPLVSLSDIKQVPQTVDLIEEIDQEVYYQNLSTEVKEALDHLPQEESYLIKMRYFTDNNELPFRDIADRLHIPTMTCYNHFQKVMRKLRHNSKLKDYYQES